MPLFRILTGPRRGDVLELHPTASLTVGSGPDAHIHLPEDDVAPVHAQVYPAEGSYWYQDLGYGYSLLDLEVVANTTRELREPDVLVVGRTFLQFLEEPPAVFADRTADGVTSDADLEPLRHRVEELEATLERTRTGLAEAGTELGAARIEAENARAEAKSARADAESARADAQSARAEAQSARAEAERARAEAESARGPEELRELASAVAPPTFAPLADAPRIEGELRAARERASRVAMALATERAEPDGVQ